MRLLTPFPGLVLPSVAPVEYRANPGVPVAAYAALLECVARVGRRSLRALDVPTRVLIDPADELVSHARLEALRAEQALGRWQVVALDRRLRRGGPDFHHLITARLRLGEEAWARVERHLDALLAELGAGPARTGRTADEPGRATLSAR